MATAVLFMAAVVGYLWLLPLHLQGPDESRHLDHVKRLLQGEVLYRDVYDITTPGWVFLMVGISKLFGLTLLTARMVAAVIHALIGVLAFVACRQLGVRRSAAWACALAAAVIGQRLFPNASYHWLATLLCMLTLVLCLVRTRALWWAFAIGVTIGAIIAVHQQRGLSFGVGVAAFLVAQWLVDRRYHGNAVPARLLVRQLLAAGAGVATVVVPLLAGILLYAGFAPVWECLVLHPLFSYRNAVRTRWGNTWGGYSLLIATALYAPWALLPSVGIAARHLWWRGDPEVARQFAMLTLLGLGTLLSIAYFPDIVHLAIVVPIFLVVVAAVAEQALRFLPRRVGRPLGAALATAVMIAIGIRAYQNVHEMWELYPIPYDSAFGRIDFGFKIGPHEVGRQQVAYYDWLRQLVDSTPGRVLYVHPRANYVHLIVDARHPTRWDLVLTPPYTTRAQQRAVIAALATKRVPYVLLSPDPPRQRGVDLVDEYIREHYEQVPVPRETWADGWLWKRRPDEQEDGTDAAVPAAP